MQKIQATCTFDITPTGAYSYRPIELPGETKNGHLVADKKQWYYVVNQQRNWDTVQQVLDLRTQIDTISLPEKTGDCWCFEFTMDLKKIHSDTGRALQIILADFDQVPVIPGLDEVPGVASCIVTSGDNTNLRLKIIQDYK